MNAPSSTFAVPSASDHHVDAQGAFCAFALFVLGYAYFYFYFFPFTAGDT